MRMAGAVAGACFTCFAALVPVASGAQDDARPIDVLHYDVEVAVLADGLTMNVGIHAQLDGAPDEWQLELAGSMRVSSASAAGRELPFRQEGGRLVLDLSGVPAGASELDVDVAIEGTPFNQFPADRGGYVRTKVDAEIAYIRSQYAWLPRAMDDPATYRTLVDAPRDWIVQTAGRRTGVQDSGERRIWTFEESHPVRQTGLVAGPYRAVEAESAGDLALAALVFPGHEEAGRALLSVARDALARYSERFGDIAGESFSIVEMPSEFGAGSGYGEAGYVLIGSGAFASTEPAPWVRATVAHEAAHLWWGRALEFANFANEALASYATLELVEAVEGADSARSLRAKAVGAVLAAAADGKEVALADIPGFGGGMDPETYRVHAYDKGMMLLAMVESAVGRDALDAALRDFLGEKAGALVGWTDLADALRGAGREARAVVDQWEVPGIPALALDVETKKAGRAWRVTGSLTQEGTQKPFRMVVPIVAVCGEERVEELVTLKGKKASVRFEVPSEPQRVLIDPGYRLLVGRPMPSEEELDAAIKRAHEVVGSPLVTDEERCLATIQLLRGLLETGPGKYEGYCHTGIGRCLFRVGRFDEAKTSLETALRFGAGGPFHRGWVHLRLGNIADLEGRREDALEHYALAQDPGASKAAAAEAKKFAERPYER